MPSPAFAFLCLGLWAIATFVGIAHVLALKRRSPRTDYAVEVPNAYDVRTPDHCVLCGAAHPTERLRIYRRYMGTRGGYSGLPKLFFPFCRNCARPIRRERRFGNVLAVIGALALLVALALIVSSRHHASRYAAGAFLILVAAGFDFVGMPMLRWGPGVAVSVAGTLFRFSNHHFRDAFAAVNGVS